MSDESDDLMEQGIKLIRQAFAAKEKKAVREFVANLRPSDTEKVTYTPPESPLSRPANECPHGFHPDTCVDCNSLSRPQSTTIEKAKDRQ